MSEGTGCERGGGACKQIRVGRCAGNVVKETEPRSISADPAVMMPMNYTPTVSIPPPELDDRNLGSNQLSALDVGLFDKNAALELLYVDQEMGMGCCEGWYASKGAGYRCCEMTRRYRKELREHIGRSGDDHAAAELRPPPSFDNRGLFENRLTALDVGLYDRNTALRIL